MANDTAPLSPLTEQDHAMEKAAPKPGMDDATLVALIKKCKREAFENRWVFERQWMRNLHYLNYRQWIVYDQSRNEWRDRRLAKSIPRPTSSLPKSALQAIRAIFTAVKIGVNIRPNGNDPANISAAATADDMAPLMHSEHQMDDVMNEADYWFIGTGNVFLHTFLDRDYKYGKVVITAEECQDCGTVSPSNAIADAKQSCPDCGSQAFRPALDDMGQPISDTQPEQRGATIALSPFELAFPNNYARFSDVPYVIRMRWRTRDYYENHPALKEQVATLNWQKSASERSLQIFRTLPNQNDMGMSPGGTSGAVSDQVDGLPEYELWYRPCDKYPDGLIVRWVGDSEPRILHLEEDEAIPGVLPYTDVGGNALFPFFHAAFEQVGGRVYGSGPIDAIIDRVNQINRVDSMTEMIIQRMSNPVWMIPKGSEIERFTGDPGLVVKWNPLTVGGNAKPERIAGLGPDASLFTLREQYIHDVEEAAATFDIIKGAKPTGVEAFSALQLLVERSQSRFANAFQARGNLYKNWFKLAIEIEREFGPEKRVQSVLSPGRGYTFQTFMNADLQGSITVVVEDGSTTPKTSLGMRAAMEHANQLGMLNMQDPDQQYAGLQLMGLTRFVPSLDIHMQAALQKQEAFEKWLQDPQAQQDSMAQAQQGIMEYQQTLATTSQDPMSVVPGAPPPQVAPPPPITKFTPLRWYAWFSPAVHKQEFMKWANSDRMRQALQENPSVEGLLTAHLQEIDAALNEQMMAQAMAQAPPGKPGGAGAAMSNANQNGGDAKGKQEPKGQGEGAQGHGPA